MVKIDRIIEDFKKKVEDHSEKNKALNLINDIGFTKLKDLEKPHEYRLV
jgi:hypothetical protein